MNKLRKNISDLIVSTLLAYEDYSSQQLAKDAGLPHGIICRAITHGIVELSDFVDICRGLDLDAAAVLAEAVNHVSVSSITRTEEEEEEEEPEPLTPSDWADHDAAANWHDITDADIPLPTNRYVEIDISHCTLIAHYLADGNHWQIGADATIPHAKVTRWRECTSAQLDQLNETLANAK